MKQTYEFEVDSAVIDGMTIVPVVGKIKVKLPLESPRYSVDLYPEHRKVVHHLCPPVLLWSTLPCGVDDKGINHRVMAGVSVKSFVVENGFVVKVSCDDPLEYQKFVPVCFDVTPEEFLKRIGASARGSESPQPQPKAIEAPPENVDDRLIDYFSINRAPNGWTRINISTKSKSIVDWASRLMEKIQAG